MRIAHFTSSLLDPLGGAEQYCLALAEWQKEQGHECTVVSSWISEPVRSSLEAKGIVVLEVRSKRPYPPNRKGTGLRRVLFHSADLAFSRSAPKAFRRCVRSGFDVVHVHRFQGLGSGLLVGKKLPVVHTVHDFSLVDPNTTSVRGEIIHPFLKLFLGIRRRCSNLSIRSTQVMIFPSQRTYQRHLDLGLRPERAIVLPHGWKVESRPKQADPRNHRFPEESLIFLFLGKLTTEKGVANLLEGWGAGVEGAELWIGGAGDLEEQCRAIDGRNGVRFLGWLDSRKRAEVLDQADVLVVPSLWPENFPLVVAEGLLSGLPVLTSASASPPLVVDGETGLVALDDSAEALRASIVQLAGDRDLYGRLAEGALAASALLDMDRHGLQILKIYERAIANNCDDMPSSMNLTY